eukprot:1152384-Pelagomonas_calceolata.AAC.3
MFGKHPSKRTQHRPSGLALPPHHRAKIKCCEETRPVFQLEASQQQHRELSKQLQSAEITLHTILLGVGGTIYTAHTPDRLIQLGIYLQRSTKLARKLHAHSVQYAHELTSTRRAVEIKSTRNKSGAMGQHASINPPDPH